MAQARERTALPSLVGRGYALRQGLPGLQVEVRRGLNATEAAKTQSFFREVNERMRERHESLDQVGGSADFLCECAREGCPGRGSPGFSWPNPLPSGDHGRGRNTGARRPAKRCKKLRPS